MLGEVPEWGEGMGDGSWLTGKQFVHKNRAESIVCSELGRCGGRLFSFTQIPKCQPVFQTRMQIPAVVGCLATSCHL